MAKDTLVCLLFDETSPVILETCAYGMMEIALFSMVVVADDLHSCAA
jgi:hypothetical protein